MGYFRINSFKAGSITFYRHNSIVLNQLHSQSFAPIINNLKLQQLRYKFRFNILAGFKKKKSLVHSFKQFKIDESSKALIILISITRLETVLLVEGLIQILNTAKQI